jgi:hypothetical protein
MNINNLSYLEDISEASTITIKGGKQRTAVNFVNIFQDASALAGNGTGNVGNTGIAVNIAIVNIFNVLTNRGFKKYR